MSDLRELDDETLAEYASDRERLYREALAETDRRAKDRGIPEWSEHSIAAFLARFAAADRKGRRHLYFPDSLPPAMFRLGYEWAAQSIISVLDGIFESTDTTYLIEHQITAASKGLYRIQPQKARDVRKHVALEMIEMLEAFFQSTPEGMLRVMPARRSTYKPSDDDAIDAAALSRRKPMPSRSSVLGGRP